MAETDTIIDRLKVALQKLQGNAYPEVSNPRSCKKRASVALVLRIRPSLLDLESFIQEGVSSSQSESVDVLSSFFKHTWAQRGDPELLLIKRATRHGDRWTGHVALPGGKRETNDEDDQVVSIRETMEEIGLDLRASYSTFIGNLPQRVVTTSWGQTPLMVLCPYVFLITSHNVPPLRLQPSEVAAVHWVPLRALLSPSLRTYESCNVSDRLTRQRGLIARLFFHTILGKMLFPAVQLVTSESLYCSSTQEFLPDEPPPISTTPSLKNLWTTVLLSWDSSRITKLNQPLLLWGLTHGIVTDFLDLLPSHDTSKLWTWPTFSHWDIQLVLWLITCRFRKRRLHAATTPSPQPVTIIEEGFSATIGTDGWQSTTISPLSNPPPSTATATATSSATARMLDGYFHLVRRALLATFLLRAGFGAAALTTTFLLLRKRHARMRVTAPVPPTT